jgi:hypothetical protein
VPMGQYIMVHMKDQIPVLRKKHNFL